ncbi:unnamed protein product, partial [marine sediment metagenome]
SCLARLKIYLYGKDIVLFTMQQDRYRTPEALCREFGIKNFQTKFQNGTPQHKRCQKQYPNLKVVGFDRSHYEIVEKIGDNNVISTTGVAAIIPAICVKPKNIYIIGIDFYNMNVKSYFVREDHDVTQEYRRNKLGQAFRYKMMGSINRACDNFPEINFYMYTTCRMIKSRKNFHVVYV